MHPNARFRVSLHTYVGISNLKNESRTNATITIVWDPADSPNCGPVLNYNVTIVNSVNGTEMSTTTLNDTRLEIFNLMSGTAYNITVAAVNRAGTGLTSTVTVTTRTDEEEEGTYECTYITFNMYNMYISYSMYYVWISFSAYLCTYMIMYVRKVVMNELLLTTCICDPIYENPCIFGNRYFCISVFYVCT